MKEMAVAIPIKFTTLGEDEGELDSHSLAGKKRVDQATTEAEDRSQDG